MNHGVLYSANIFSLLAGACSLLYTLKINLVYYGNNLI